MGNDVPCMTVSCMQPRCWPLPRGSCLAGDLDAGRGRRWLRRCRGTAAGGALARGAVRAGGALAVRLRVLAHRPARAAAMWDARCRVSQQPCGHSLASLRAAAAGERRPSLLLGQRVATRRLSPPEDNCGEATHAPYAKQYHFRSTTVKWLAADPVVGAAPVLLSRASLAELAHGVGSAAHAPSASSRGRLPNPARRACIAILIKGCVVSCRRGGRHDSTFRWPCPQVRPSTCIVHSLHSTKSARKFFLLCEALATLSLLRNCRAALLIG